MKNFFESLREKLSSWAMWLSIGALVVFCVKGITGVDISAEVNDFLDVLCPVLVGFGIVNNPNSKNNI